MTKEAFVLVEEEKLQTAAEKKPAILVVDDSRGVRNFLKTMLENNGYRCAVASGVEEAQLRLQESDFEVILFDLIMPPGRSGMELLEEVNEKYPDMAAIMLTGVDDPEIGRNALRLGAYGYLTKPFSENQVLLNVENALIRRRLGIENRNYRAQLENAVLERTRELMATISRLELAQRTIRHSQQETILRLAIAAEFRDTETARHIQRIGLFCELLARRLGLDEERCSLIGEAAPMHDIGKIGITDRILLKPGRHTRRESTQMKEHCDFGYRMLAGSDSELLDLAATVAWTHHEKYDGSGYPRGLAGEDIPLVGRLTAIADVFDALTSKRVYKPAFPLEESFTLMKEQRNRHFDPDLLDLFFDVLPEVLAIKEKLRDEGAA
ncbi:MAG: response regulator [SAR324 cluster bacterium]|nr:response regulator [SAR324 cluster bacterium]